MSARATNRNNHNNASRALARTASGVCYDPRVGMPYPTMMIAPTAQSMYDSPYLLHHTAEPLYYPLHEPAYAGYAGYPPVGSTAIGLSDLLAYGPPYTMVPANSKDVFKNMGIAATVAGVGSGAIMGGAMVRRQMGFSG